MNDIDRLRGILSEIRPAQRYCETLNELLERLDGDEKKAWLYTQFSAKRGNSSKEMYEMKMLLKSISDCRTVIAEEISETKRQRAEAMKLIRCAQGEQEIKVLEAHYINGETWEEIANKMSYSTRMIQNIAKKALTTISEECKQLSL